MRCVNAPFRAGYIADLTPYPLCVKDLFRCGKSRNGKGRSADGTNNISAEIREQSRSLIRDILLAANTKPERTTIMTATQTHSRYRLPDVTMTKNRLGQFVPATPRDTEICLSAGVELVPCTRPFELVRRYKRQIFIHFDKTQDKA